MVTAIICASVLAVTAAPTTPQVRMVDAWQVEVTPGVVRVGKRTVKVTSSARLSITPADMVVKQNERFDPLPMYDPAAPPWVRGVKMHGMETFEAAAADMLVPESVVVKSEDGATTYQVGVDYQFERQWATLGRLPNGAIPAGKPVLVDYRFGRFRLDSIVVDSHGTVSVLTGVPHPATPLPPAVSDGVTVIANVWVPGRIDKLTEDNLYPITEPQYPEPKTKGKTVAEKLLPKTWAKLHNGQPLHVLAWGDSVTAGGQASDPAHQYQSRFVTLLQKRFAHSSVKLTTVAWGGRNSDSFLAEPPGSQYNFKEKVIAAKPDLIVMEFVNDAYLNAEQVEQKYSWLLSQFQQIGAEWVIIGPHFVRPDWMGATSVRVQDDPRPYVAAIRAFAQRHNVALAETPLRWGHLIKEGIPYITLLSNSINHPDDRGHELFAQALMELFGGVK